MDVTIRVWRCGRTKEETGRKIFEGLMAGKAIEDEEVRVSLTGSASLIQDVITKIKELPESLVS